MIVTSTIVGINRAILLNTYSRIASLARPFPAKLKLGSPTDSPDLHSVGVVERRYP
jgi:hypothetical protein